MLQCLRAPIVLEEELSSVPSTRAERLTNLHKSRTKGICPLWDQKTKALTYRDLITCTDSPLFFSKCYRDMFIYIYY